MLRCGTLWLSILCTMKSMVARNVDGRTKPAQGVHASGGSSVMKGVSQELSCTIDI